MPTTTSFNEQLDHAIERIDKAVLVATFMRSGTHLTIDFIRKNFPIFQKRKRVFQSSAHLYFVLDTLTSKWWGHEHFRLQFTRFLNNTERPIFKAHFIDPELSVFDDLDGLKRLIETRCKIVYVSRNLFKVLPSLWSFFETAEIQNPGFKVDYSSREEFVEKYAKKWTNHIEKWSNRPEVLFLRFEDIISSPELIAKQLAEYFNEPVPRFTGRSLLPPKNNSTLFHRAINYLHPNPSSTEIRPNNRAAKNVLNIAQTEKEICMKIAGDSMKRLGYIS